MKLVLPLLAVLTAFGTARGEPAQPPSGHPMTLAELTDLALSNNPETRSAWAMLAQSEAAEAIARAGYWPTLTGTYSWQRSQSVSPQGSGIPVQVRYGPSISLTYLLFDFGSRSGGVHEAAAQTLAARFSREQTLQDLMLTVESGYYSVIGARALEVASRRTVQEAQGNADAARIRHDAGLATIADLYQAQAALASAQLVLQQAEGSRIIADGALAVAVGYSPDTALSLGDWQAPSKPALPKEKVSELMEAANRARPELLASQAQEQAAEAAVRSARGQGLPRVTLTAGAGKTVVEGIGTSQQNNIGVRVDVPIFSGFADRAALSSARAAVDQFRADTDSLRLNVQQQVWMAYQNVLTARKNLDAAHVQLEAADKAADAIRARYRNGLSSVLEVLSTESALAQARVSDIQAGVGWYQSLATLAHDAGGLRAADLGVLQ